jgi:hypothetical protein
LGQREQKPQLPCKTKLGIGWRPQLALSISRRKDLAFVELMAEDFGSESGPSTPVVQLMERGMEVALHSTALSLGGAQLPNDRTLNRLSQLAEQTCAFVVSDHVAYVRSEKFESGHLLPIERSKEMLEVIADNIAQAKARLGTPLALENIATFFEWPHAEMSEQQFITELLNRSDTGLLLDLSNLFANSVNHCFDAIEYLQALPLERLSYVHLAGGTFVDGVYHDTHCGLVPSAALGLLRQLCRLTRVPRVMIEIDDHFPDETLLNRQLDVICEVLAL